MTAATPTRSPAIRSGRPPKPQPWPEPFGDGIRRDHRAACPASTTRRPGHRCDCPYTFWLPREGSDQRRRARVFGTLADARRAKCQAEHAATQRRRTLSNQQAGIMPVPTLDEWFDMLMQRSWGQRRPATRERRTLDYNLRVREPFGRYRLDRITPQMVEAWMYACIERDGNRRCVHAAYETFREMLHVAKKQHLVPRNPVSAVTYPEAAMQHRPKRVLTLAEYHALLAGTRNVVERTMLRVMCEAGLRKGEAMGLQIADLDFDHGFLHIQRRYFYTLDGQLDIDLPKNGKTRTAAINPSLVEELREHVTSLATDTPADTLLWTRCNRYTGFETKPLTGSSMTKILRHAAKTAGLANPDGTYWLNLHRLRASGASIAVAAGVSPLIAKEQLGHSRLEITEQHYLHLPALEALRGYGAVFE